MRVIVSILSFLVLMGCKKSDHISNCIQSRVDQFESSSLCTAASITEYNFHGKSVYVFSEGICFIDVPDAVYDVNCNFLGVLGGSTGTPKIDDDFNANAKFIRTIWHN